MLREKRKESRPGYKRFPQAGLHSVYGLSDCHPVPLLFRGTRERHFQEPDAGNLPISATSVNKKQSQAELE